MRPKVLLLLLLLGCLAQTGLASPIVDFDADSIYVGKFTEENDIPEVTFSFCNTGDTELDYSRIVTSCGVTVSYFVAPEAEAEYTGEITVQIDLHGIKNGDFSKHIYLYGNAPTKRLVVYGQVDFPVKVVLPELFQ